MRILHSSNIQKVQTYKADKLMIESADSLRV